MRKKELFLTLLIGCLCLGGCSQAVQSQETNKMSYTELEQKYEKLLKENEELKNAGYHHPLFFIHHYRAFALVILSAASKMPSLPDSYVRPPCI